MDRQRRSEGRIRETKTGRRIRDRQTGRHTYRQTDRQRRSKTGAIEKNSGREGDKRTDRDGMRAE